MEPIEELREKLIEKLNTEKKYEFDFRNTNLPKLLPEEQRYYDTKVTRIVEGLTKELIHLGTK